MAKPSGSRAALSPNASASASTLRPTELVNGVSRNQTIEKIADQQRQRRRIGAVAQAEPAAPPGERDVECPGDDGESDAVEQREVDGELERVIEHVMAHLVPEHRADLGQGRLVQEVVVEADARDAAQPGDVGADARGLFRGIEPLQVVGRNLIRPCQRQHRLAHRTLPAAACSRCTRARCSTGSSRSRNRVKTNAKPVAHTHQRRPARRRNAYTIVIASEPRTTAQREADQLLAQPARKGQVRQAVLVLAQEILIDRQRQAEHEGATRKAAA